MGQDDIGAQVGAGRGRTRDFVVGKRQGPGARESVDAGGTPEGRSARAGKTSGREGDRWFPQNLRENLRDEKNSRRREQRAGCDQLRISNRGDKLCPAHISRVQSVVSC